MLTINSYDEFATYEGKELGVSEWVLVSQERINQFADATDDHQWIHIDEEKCKAESPFGQTIAHGYLTISLIPLMWNQTIQVNNLERMMNYGMEKMRFGQPVLSGQNIRMKVTLDEIQNLRGAVKTNVKFVVEIKETGKKAVEGIATFVYYFKN
ncbi:MAG: MaoC family dehydratase [Bacteroidaceae bacterium]|jgi:acyl dehydratase|nr:MaoC family dehydratase [Bacteroidaceae bacterium]